MVVMISKQNAAIVRGLFAVDAPLSFECPTHAAMRLRHEWGHPVRCKATLLFYLVEGRVGLFCREILLQMKEKNRPQGIALTKVAACVGPAGMAEFHEGLSTIAG